MAGRKLGVVRLGRAAGKTKFTVLDEESVNVLLQYVLEPRMIMDRDGNGTRIFAYAYESIEGRRNARKVHEIIWELNHGQLHPGHEIVHRNGITVDNRIENLQLCRTEFEKPREFPSLLPNPNSVYYQVIQRIPEEPVDESFFELNSLPCYRRNEGGGTDYDRNLCFFECHYRPCSNIEKEAREFSVCGHCHQVRYCGPTCQRTDWTVHKKHCRPRKRKRRNRSVSPER